MLNTEPNVADPDDFYAALLESHRGLSLEQSAMFNAKLILLLANHIGEIDVLKDAMAQAGEGLSPAALDTPLQAAT